MKKLILMAFIMLSVVFLSSCTSDKLVPEFEKTFPKTYLQDKGLDIQCTSNKKDLNFDVKKVLNTEGKDNIISTFIFSSSVLKEHSYNKVFISYKGDRKYYVSGDYFKRVSMSKDLSEALKFTQELYNLNGEKAFKNIEINSIFDLSILGVQMETFLEDFIIEKS